jgi:putative hemolysin
MFELIIIIVCILLNSVLACVEMAFITVSKPHLKKMAQGGDRRAQKILDLKINPDRVLSALQLGITLLGSVSAVVAGAGAEEVLRPYYESRFQLSGHAAEALTILTIVLPLTYFSVVVGELVPKTLALKYPMRIAKLSVFLLRNLNSFITPIIDFLNNSTKLIIGLIIKSMGTEMKVETAATIEIDTLSEAHKQYVLNLINVDKRKVKDILLPWPSVVKINTEAHHHEILDLIKQSKHTRMPVIKEEAVIGILHAKEFIAESEVARLNWLELVRPVICLKHDEPILNALKILQNNKNHMAVIKRQQEVIGVVTLEDIFEEVVGEIYDEDDSPQALLSSNSKIRQMNLPPKKP